MPRGGKRVGRSGAAYSNRSDLNAPKPHLTSVSNVYGEAEKLRQAQRAVPAAAAPTVLAGAATPTGQPSPLPGGGPQSPTVLPGSLPPLTGPSQRPDEPLTAGMPSGPGPGPSVISQPLPVDPIVTGLAALNHLGDGGLPELAALRRSLQAHADNLRAP